ncbi:MAG: phosphoadenosine phosphosulfate reductase family protein [Nitrososphaeria archaeon]
MNSKSYLRREVGKVISEFSKIVKENNIKNIYSLFSGGRDSLVALHITNIFCKKYNVKLKAVYVDTTISTPGSMEYVKEVCDSINVHLDVVKPRQDYFKLVEKWGFPTATRRWCCYHLKIEPLKTYFTTQLQDRIVVDGIRMKESFKRKSFPKIGFHKHFKCLCYHPIFEWDKDDVLNYIKEFDLKENPLYKFYPRATECWCPAEKTVNQFKQLKKTHPELFNKLVELEGRLRNGGSALFKGGKKIYLKEL